MSEFTKIAIMDSLIDLLRKKPFTKITVKDIVTHCGINRNTFYYYFEDIYDLLHQTAIYEIKKTDIEHITLLNYQEKVNQILKSLSDNKSVVLHIYNSVDTKRMVAYLRSIFLPALDNYCKELLMDLNLPVTDVDFFLEALCDALIGFLLNWADHQFDEAFFQARFDMFTHWLKTIINFSEK